MKVLTEGKIQTANFLQREYTATFVENAARDPEDFLERWTETLPPGEPPRLDRAVLANHVFNALIWSIDDRTYTGNRSSEQIVADKRRVDFINKCRNSEVVSIDQILSPHFPETSDAPYFSESPGSIIDRLSILELKLFHLKLIEEQGSRSESLAEKLTLVQTQKNVLLEASGHMEDLLLRGKMRFWCAGRFKLFDA